ncbi:hypothetical protein [Ralstonia soli]|uniref:Toxin CptA n=1 Tax=Ralstonia soli TaxID=2953896 RepID=A0ABT1AIE1_9RALS|nr:hypothetical protein [Ralstonia soli]MCO5398165.1 hypothetical protein [Ralstonia soli]
MCRFIFALIVQHVVFPTPYRRLCAVGRISMAGVICVVLCWLFAAWGTVLPPIAWAVVGGLAAFACVPLAVNRSPLEMELMWRARLKEDGEPGEPIWQLRLKMAQSSRNAPLLWSWPLGERVLVLGVAGQGWCPQIFVLMPPWFGAATLRWMRTVLRLGPPPAVCQAGGVS